MKNTSGNMTRTIFPAIIKGASISVISLLILCAVTACIIQKGLISQENSMPVTLFILLTASFLGAKCSSIASGKRRSILPLITGASFLLLLLMTNITILKTGTDNILPKIISVLTGTACGSLSQTQKGSKRGERKHRRNR